MLVECEHGGEILQELLRVWWQKNKINNKKAAEKLYVICHHSEFLSSYYMTWGKNQVSHGRQLGFCKRNTFEDIKLSETTINVDYLTPFLLTFIMFIPRD